MSRILVVVFDALRPDMVSAELMPRLFDFAQSGVRYTQSRSVFPTETRVNQTSMVTGCRPGRHGIVGNKFIEPVASPDALFNTGNEDVLREGDERLGGALLGVPSLGERLAEKGLRFATLSAGTPGGGRILNHRAERHGGFRLAMHAPQRAVPEGVFDRITERIGALAKHSIPSHAWVTFAVDAWLKWVEPEERPDVGVLWLCEPDNSYHYCGIGAPENLDVIAHVDAQFGRLLDAYAGTDTSIITLSDHGQIAVAGESIDLAEKLREGGFSVGPVPGPQADVAIALDSGGGLFVRDRSVALAERVAQFAVEQPWCGAVSLADPGQLDVFSHAEFGIDGSRAPDVGLVLRASDTAGPWGWHGTSLQNGAYPDGGGIHGGLHPVELNNWLAAGGPGFASGVTIDTPAGVIDILPTILAQVGAGAPDDVDGRVLFESFANFDGTPPEVRTHQKTAQSGRVVLRSRSVADSRYLDGLEFPA